MSVGRIKSDEPAGMREKLTCGGSEVGNAGNCQVRISLSQLGKLGVTDGGSRRALKRKHQLQPGA